LIGLWRKVGNALLTEPMQGLSVVELKASMRLYKKEMPYFQLHVVALRFQHPAGVQYDVALLVQ
jgi:hypothetical protein